MDGDQLQSILSLCFEIFEQLHSFHSSSSSSSALQDPTMTLGPITIVEFVNRDGDMIDVEVLLMELLGLFMNTPTSHQIMESCLEGSSFVADFFFPSLQITPSKLEQWVSGSSHLFVSSEEDESFDYDLRKACLDFMREGCYLSIQSFSMFLGASFQLLVHLYFMTCENSLANIQDFDKNYFIELESQIYFIGSFYSFFQSDPMLRSQLHEYFFSNYNPTENSSIDDQQELVTHQMLNLLFQDYLNQEVENGNGEEIEQHLMIANSSQGNNKQEHFVNLQSVLSSICLSPSNFSLLQSLPHHDQEIVSMRKMMSGRCLWCYCACQSLIGWREDTEKDLILNVLSNYFIPYLQEIIQSEDMGSDDTGLILYLTRFIGLISMKFHHQMKHEESFPTNNLSIFLEEFIPSISTIFTQYQEEMIEESTSHIVCETMVELIKISSDPSILLEMFQNQEEEVAEEDSVLISLFMNQLTFLSWFHQDMLICDLVGKESVYYIKCPLFVIWNSDELKNGDDQMIEDFSQFYLTSILSPIILQLIQTLGEMIQSHLIPNENNDELLCDDDHLVSEDLIVELCQTTDSFIKVLNQFCSIVSDPNFLSTIIQTFVTYIFQPFSNQILIRKTNNN